MPKSQDERGETNRFSQLLTHQVWTFVGVVVAVVAIFVSVWIARRQTPANTNNRSPLPTPLVRSDDRTPSPTPREIPASLPNASAQPSIHPSAPSSANLPVQEPPRSGTAQPTKVIDNDIGKSKKNGFYEITVENAWISTDRVRFEGCYVDLASGQKAILVRFAIMAVNFRTRSAEEQFHFGAVKPSDFVLVDDWNKRVDAACQNFPIFVRETANTKTLIYLVRTDSRRLTFKFQKVGAGEAITFDLSDLE